MNDIQSRLRARREKLGLTIRDVGERIGVVHSAVAKWEHHTTDIPLRRLASWVEALGLRMTIVVTPLGEEETPIRLSDENMSEEQRALVRSVLDLIPELSDDEAAMLRGQMEGLAARRRARG